MAAIFVETHIAADIERVWELTQDPSQHQRWDLRFSEISYLPKTSPEEPQRFRYRTRIGLGIAVAGEGESVGEQNQEGGKRTSALKFWSDDPKALIREGSGFWQYEPDASGTKFRTRYDYRVRYGPLGKLLDLAFRPIIGTATAWSFDAMKLWAERDIPPEASVLRMRIHAICRIALAAMWLYQGVVPKMLYPQAGELDMVIATGFPATSASQIALTAGVVEVLIGLALIAFWRARGFLLAQAVLPIVMPLGLIGKSDVFVAPFNPVTTALGMAALGICGFLAAKDMPSAANCLRRPKA
jgi:hypothetical protein